MQITWDEPKRLANLEKHGLDFADFEAGFDFASAIEYPARSSRTGRARKTLIGTLGGETLVVAIVSALGAEALSLVSLRRASARERAAYGP